MRITNPGSGSPYRMNPEPFDWQRFHAYRVFDEFLERFVLHRMSYVTRHPDPLYLAAAFEDIRERFVAAFDNSETRFEEKLALQFEGASEKTKIVFANVEYLWAMPMGNISAKKKRSYAQRWFFGPDQVVSGEHHFFGYPHIIANPGSWYLRNKYWELVAALRVLSLVTAEPGLNDLTALKQRIAEICHAAIYEGIPAVENFAVSKVCGIHSALMHLADPERYESIISASHRRQICAVFDVRLEEDAADLEGDKEEVKGYCIRRSAKLVKAAKLRDSHSCRGCGFHFEDQIVHVHHLDPLSEYKRPQETKLEDLLTLCPTCHYLAHYWLRQNTRYKRLEPLLTKLRSKC